MRTKTLILAAAGVAVGLTAATAQDAVYSVNAVGYVNTDLQTGFNLISNPLNNGDNTLNSAIPDIAPGTTAFIFNGAGFDNSLFLPGVGWSPNAEVAPGGGFFLDAQAGTDSVTFVGEVPQGDLSNEYPAGLSIRSSQVPQAGDLSADLGLALGAGDTVFLFNGSGFDASLFLPGLGFSPAAEVGVGEAFFVQATAAGSWDRSFSVND